MKTLSVLIALALLTFSQVSEADEDLSPKQKQYYNWILQKSGETGALISSRDRTPEKQVSVMWNNCVAKSGGQTCKKQFLAPGYNRICSVFMLDAFDGSTDDATNKAEMTKALSDGLRSLGNTRPCMQHVVVPGIARLNRAIDVKPSSVTDHAKFYDAVMHKDSCADKSRFFYPPIPGKPASSTPDRAFHIEFRLDGSCP